MATSENPTDQDSALPEELEAKEAVQQKCFLQEWKVVESILDDIVSNGGVSDPKAPHKIRSLMDKYQEQGQLVEPYLECMVTPLMFIVRSKTLELGVDADAILQVIKPISIIIYSLVTVCGYKAVVRFFPHQVFDLELAVSLLEKCHTITSVSSSLRQESTGEMEAKCVILLWLSILVLIPFDISSVDTSISYNNTLEKVEPAPLVLRITGISKDYLSDAGPMRTIAALLLSKLLTRPDMPKPFFSFLEWTHQVLSSHTDDVMNHFQLIGTLEALVAIFKAGGRKLLLDVVPIIWDDISLLINSSYATRNPLLRKYLMKLTQRIGLTFIPHRSSSWRYVGKTSSLGDNISFFASRKTGECKYILNAGDPNSEQSSRSLENEEEMDIPEIVEEIIEILLTGLRDMNTVVRWSAAKGIGRITSCLTYALSVVVLSHILKLFLPGEGDGSWHGGCLALAELARRGLLLPLSLHDVVPIVVKALHYDIRRGHHSVGSHVRDAAAYVCWAFGRAYDSTVMRDIFGKLAPHILTMACYDREVNCRRAAAAAFQENVGRQGSYPHGIDVVNTADYFSLSSRAYSYVDVAVSIAKYENYLYHFVDELLYKKICHWEKGLRELAAVALSSLVMYDHKYAIFALKEMICRTLSSDLCMRHGATLAAGELVLALYQCDHPLSVDEQKSVAGVVLAIEKARLYRGKGGEIMRSAVSRFVECISVSSISLSENIKRSLLATVCENLRHPNSQIHYVYTESKGAAVKALKHFVRAYLVNADITSKFLEDLTDPNVAVRRGSALAIGVLPGKFLATRWKDVLLKLCSSCAIEVNPDDRDAEARANAVKGLVSVCETLTHENEQSRIQSMEDNLSLFLLIKHEVMETLLKALDDYSVDNRGDVGSWVREAAMDGLERCTYILCKQDYVGLTERSEHVDYVLELSTADSSQLHLLFDANLATRVVGGICKQAVEKMDKLRETAAKILHRLLYNKITYVQHIPHRKKLEELVPNEADLKWAVPSFSYPRFVHLLQFSSFSRLVLSGLVISVGGLQDSLAKASVTALLNYLQVVDGEEPKEMSREYRLATDMLWVLQQYRGCDRVIVPAMKTIEILLSKKIFLTMEAYTSIFISGALHSLEVELKGSKDFFKLYLGIAILGYIALHSDSINTPAFHQLLRFLGYRFPKIRRTAAEQVLSVIQVKILVRPGESKLHNAVKIVSETCWEGDLEAAKQQRFELYNIAGLETDLIRSRSSNNNGCRNAVTVDENESYSSLVEFSGY
ncbi:hypothetical protein OROMI_025288 [Orobanche minor]